MSPKDPRTSSNRLLNNKIASNWPQKQPQSYVGGHFQNLHEKICLHWPLVTSFFSHFWPEKHAHENRGIKRASHVKFELNLWCGTPSNRLLNNKTASNWPQKQPQSYV